MDRNEKLLTVYVLDLSGEYAETLRQIGGPFLSAERLEESIRRSGRYEHTFRFQLFDAKWRVFQTQRYCYRGPVDAWTSLGVPVFFRTWHKRISSTSGSSLTTT